jgi:hypothetical protein
MGGGAVVADHPQHVLGVAPVAREGPKLARHFGGGRIGDAGHHGGQCARHRPARVAVIAEPHVHQQPADVGIAEAEGPEVVAKLRDFLGRELRHGHADLQRHGPQPGGVHVGIGVELAVLEEGQQVQRGEVAGGVVEEHVFRAGVAAPDRPVLGAGVPCVDRVVVLDPRIGAGPCGVADLLPQVAGLDRAGYGAVAPVDQLPVAVRLDGLEEGVGDADRVVGILAGNSWHRLRSPSRCHRSGIRSRCGPAWHSPTRASRKCRGWRPSWPRGSRP